MSRFRTLVVSAILALVVTFIGSPRLEAPPAYADNCFGQANTMLAQEFGGNGNLARMIHMSPGELHSLVRTLCGLTDDAHEVFVLITLLIPASH